MTSGAQDNLDVTPKMMDVGNMVHMSVAEKNCIYASIFLFPSHMAEIIFPIYTQQIGQKPRFYEIMYSVAFSRIQKLTEISARLTKAHTKIEENPSVAILE